MSEGESDKLSFLRTRLSFSRTFLAFIRTGISFVMAGFALIHYFPMLHDWHRWLGSLFCLIGVMLFFLSVKENSAHRKALELEEQRFCQDDGDT